MVKLNHWVNQNFDDDEVRRKFRRALCRLKELATPYWKSDFIDRLIYEGTIHPYGVKVKEISPTYCTFEANSSGVQSEGICLITEFKIETCKFTRKELAYMVHDFEISPAGTRLMALFDTENITSLTWFYDGGYDETAS